MRKTIRVSVELPELIEGCDMVQLRQANLGDLWFNGFEWAMWTSRTPSAVPVLVAVLSKMYRTPVLPEDWSELCEFSHDKIKWVVGRLTGYVKDDAEETVPPWSYETVCGRNLLKHAQFARIEVQQEP